MAYQQKENSGALFKNDRKQNERQPDYTGKIDVGGKLFYLSAWLKESARGKFMLLAIKPADEQDQRSQYEPDPL